MGEVSSEVAGEEAGLDREELLEADFLLEQGMVQFSLFAFLPSLDDFSSAFVGELDGAAFAFIKMFGLDLLAVDEGDGEAVGEPGAEFFHEVERGCRPAGPGGVEPADVGVEPGGGEGGETVVAQEGVEKGEEAVDFVARRAARAEGEGERLPLLLEHGGEASEVKFCANAFGASDGVEGFPEFYAFGGWGRLAKLTDEACGFSCGEG